VDASDLFFIGGAASEEDREVGSEGGCDRGFADTDNLFLVPVDVPGSGSGFRIFVFNFGSA